MAAGAIGEASSTITNQSDNSAKNAGAAYIFRRAGVIWTQEAYVKASTVGGGDQFGRSISLSSNGTKLAVGANLEDSNSLINPSDNSAMESGAVFVFSYKGNSWRPDSYIKAPNIGPDANFGYSLTLSADGKTLGVGAHRESSSNVTAPFDNSARFSGAAYVLQP
jgi:FG-GAP repeat